MIFKMVGSYKLSCQYEELHFTLDFIETITTLILLGLHFFIRTEVTAAFTVVTLWVRLMFSLGDCFWFGRNIHMFRKVFANLLTALFPCFVCLTIGFSLAFHILFPKTRAFSLWNSFVSVLVMATGELDYKDHFYGNEANNTNQDYLHEDQVEDFPKRVVQFIFLVLFIFSFVIVLMNLATGVAVSDIQTLKQEALSNQLVRQVQLIGRMEMYFATMALLCRSCGSGCSCLTKKFKSWADMKIECKLECVLRDLSRKDFRVDFKALWWTVCGKKVTLSADINEGLYRIIKESRQKTLESLSEEMKTLSQKFGEFVTRYENDIAAENQ